jgi:hypothetical protein
MHLADVTINPQRESLSPKEMTERLNKNNHDVESVVCNTRALQLPDASAEKIIL